MTQAVFQKKKLKRWFRMVKCTKMRIKLRKKIDAKNSLENYCFQMKNSINDEKLREKISEEDKQVIEDSCAEGLQYLESNQDASIEEYEAKK
jgi:L1 cell adhesion molecule like protein